jgi:hypothetical protein
MWHFPLISWFKQMFKAPTLSQLMRWHQGNKSQDVYVKHAIDSKAWAQIDSLWPQFATNARNLRKGHGLDAVNPFGNQSTTWST